MKYLLILFLICIGIQAEDKKQTITIGAGSYIQTQPYKDVDDIVLPSPVIFFDNGIVYVRWSRVGIYFLGNEKDDYAWGFSLTTQPRTY
ncbi:MAG: MipA/OmpV family protein, partial [Sulfurimonas sp.]|nr:MipA/OmpV family protein [Sulfurimonas sp.]